MFFFVVRDDVDEEKFVIAEGGSIQDIYASRQPD